jgi:soluble lytic murein transglycosylase-like protein
VSILDDARRDAGIKRRVRLLVAAGETAVLTWGVRRPVILLPASASAWSAERLRVVILHELQHVRRRDALYDVAAQIALIIHWPNPLAWYAVGRLRAERELACDCGVVSAGISPLAYAGHLVDLARTVNRGTSHGLAVIGAGAGFEARVVTLMRQRRLAAGSRTLAWLAAAAAALLGAGSAVVRPELSFAAPAEFITDVDGSDAAYLSRHYGIPVELSRAISRSADAEGVDRVLAHALVHAQSGFHREAAGPGVGLTRITPATAARHAPDVTAARLREDETNLRVGFRYLAALIRHYDGEVDAALAAYHLGPGAVGVSREQAKAAPGGKP